MLRLTEFALYSMTWYAFREILRLSGALASVAFVASRREVIGIRHSPATVSFNVVNDGSQFIKQWRFVPSPAVIVVGKRSG